MVWIDYAIIAVIGVSCFLSLIRGFIRKALLMLSLIRWGSALFIASHYYSYLSVWLSDFGEKLFQNAVASTFLFIVTMIIGSLFNCVMGHLFKKVDLSGIDGVFGICFGAFRGVLIITMIVFFLDTFTEFSKNENWQKSQLIPLFSFIIEWFFSCLKTYQLFLRLNDLV